ncbi:hypothetical protein [Marinagarivorans algicola]|nr:hypothetical protein [Marinagarivorans algicola]
MKKILQTFTFFALMLGGILSASACFTDDLTADMDRIIGMGAKFFTSKNY